MYQEKAQNFKFIENVSLSQTESVFCFISALHIIKAENKWKKEDKGLRESKQM